ncbi:MAG: hypothetical protein Q8N10_03480 [Phenylobacterium sp.]|nr:hypothetical protein [Phenylobacterium sp.]
MPIDMAARVATNAADLAAWQRTPGGRLVGALNTLKAVGYEHTADRVYATYLRSLTRPDGRDVPLIGEALTELLSIPQEDAMPRLAVADACRALADMLAEPLTQGAA